MLKNVNYYTNILAFPFVLCGSFNDGSVFHLSFCREMVDGKVHTTVGEIILEKVGYHIKKLYQQVCVFAVSNCCTNLYIQT